MEAEKLRLCKEHRVRPESIRSLECKVGVGVAVDGVQAQKEVSLERPPLLKLADLRHLAERQKKPQSSGNDSLGAWMAEQLANMSPDITKLLPNGLGTAVEAPGLSPLTYDQLRKFLGSVDLLEALDVEPGARVAVCVQNGPQLAVAILATMKVGCCCPLDPNAPEQELARDFLLLRAEAALVDSSTGSARNAAAGRNLGCALLVPDQTSAGLFSLRPLATRKSSARPPPQGPDDSVLVLATSGTTGKKKTVPYTVETLAVGAACIIKSWNLQPKDACLNMMPLIHIGGIARNLLGVLLSGGRLVCFPFFDPTEFWPAAEERGITWYYGSPAMHRAILDEGRRRPEKQLQMRMVCNAAGGLPPALAGELLKRFRCAVLPSYGMTECMPISSPPFNFSETAPKTSGLPCGPELGIMDDGGQMLPAGQIGNIVVRGPPVMGGYESKESNEGAWQRDGWFVTGDLGYLSAEGWLYVTGRTKEVIKRGGETISPVEIEEAVVKHPDVLEAAAFAVKDSQLGENIAVALVLRPGPRIGLPRLRSFLKASLRSALLPQFLLYCADLPKTSTGKIRRAWLAQACQGVAMSQDTSWRERIFTAKTGAAVRSSEDIQVSRVDVWNNLADQALQPVFTQTRTVFDGKLRVTYGIDQVSMPIIREALAGLDDVDQPDAVVQLQEFPSSLPPPKPSDFLYQLEFEPPETPEEIIVSNVWASVLQIDQHTISATSDFFEIGGTSLLAGKVASELRIHTEGKTLPTHMVFASPKLRDLARAIAACQAVPTAQETWNPESDASTPLVSDDASFTRNMPSSVGPHVLLLQLVPLVLFPVLTGFTRYVGFLYTFNSLCSYWLADLNLSNSLNWYLALCIIPIGSMVVFPVFAILCKWLLVGRLQPGRYPIWGHVYLRWWLAQQVMNYCGLGVFKFNQTLHRLHLRLLGASISGTAVINYEASDRFIEGDLLTVEEGVLFDSAGVKCAALDGGFLVLAPVVLERHTSICQRTVVAPGTVMPVEASLGPFSSSHEMQDAHDDLRRFNRLSFPEPHWCLRYFLGYPLHAFCRLVRLVPWLLIMQFVVTGTQWTSPDDDWLDRAAEALTQPRRIALWMIASAIKDIVSVLIHIPCVVAMKWLVIGRFGPGCRRETEWEKFRYWFMDLILTKKDLSAFTSLTGSHYLPTTWFYRAMGAKVGQRVFWPGTPLEILEYDLFEVGDDVTFGSRSRILCSDAYESRKVRIQSGAMVADNCCVLPGTTLGENAILGSGSVGSGDYPANSVSIGNIHGSAVQLMLGPPQESTIRPFGRAHYIGGAPYCVITWPFIILINVLCLVFWSPLQGVRGWAVLLALRFIHPRISSLTDVLGTICLIYLALHVANVLLALVMDVALKWLLLGRRKPGVYAWDTSSFCQRWKMYVGLRETLHGGSSALRLLGGSWWIVLYYRCLGASIGRNVCLYPWGASPMMTEPDLTTLGDSVCVENASLVAHTNAMGVYQLYTLNVGSGCTMRDHSRLMAGAEMLRNSKLLEHSLAMSGDVVPEGTAWQGWPNRWQGPASAVPSQSAPAAGLTV